MAVNLHQIVTILPINGGSGTVIRLTHDNRIILANTTFRETLAHLGMSTPE